MADPMVLGTRIKSQTAVPPSRSSRSALARFGKLAQRKHSTKARGFLRPRAVRALASLAEVLRSMDSSMRRVAVDSFKPQIRAALLAFMETLGNATLKRKCSVAREVATEGGGSVWTVRREGMLKFKGRVYFGSLCVTTREQAEMAIAQKYQAILENMRKAVIVKAAANPAVWEDSDAILHTCRSTLEACGASEEVLGLSTCIIMRATQWLGPTRIVSAASTLRLALETRARLLRARSTSWEALRAEWVALLCDMDRKMPLSIWSAEAIADAARRDAMRSQLSCALRAVEHELDSSSNSAVREQRMNAPTTDLLQVATMESEGDPGAKRRKTAPGGT